MLKLTLIAILAAAPAMAQAVCMPRDDVADRLSETYGESLQAAGIANGGGAVIEVWASDGGSWTIFLSNADGTACVIAAGQDFNLAAAVPPGEPM